MEHTMEIQPRRNYFGIILLFLVVSLACTIPGFGPQEEEWPEPAPETDTISFTIPNYTVTLEPGNYVPGTFMLYRERVGDNYEVTIDGLQATKRTGDSFIWDGIVAQAVYAQYNLRLGSTNSPPRYRSKATLLYTFLAPTHKRPTSYRQLLQRPFTIPTFALITLCRPAGAFPAPI
jgi:hypothetical protein